MAIDSSVGSGRNMDAYYENLSNSQLIIPVMVYSRGESYETAPAWIQNKVLLDMPYATHPIDLCRHSHCKIPIHAHITHDQWMRQFAKSVPMVRATTSVAPIWLLDMVLPIIEAPMKRHIVQVFHGELFPIGPLPYIRPEHIDSILSYDRLLLSGQVIEDALMASGVIDPEDTRIRRIGRVLDDTLYNGTIKKQTVLREFGLDPKRKTLLYAPTWESLKLWPMGTRADDARYLRRFCSFAQKQNLNVILRPHPISIIQYGVQPLIARSTKLYRNVYFDNARLSSYYGPNKALIAADILITDLSSISAEFLSLGKPVVYLYPDRSVGIWGEGFPSIAAVRKLSYTVQGISELLSVLTRLLSKEEDSRIIKKRAQTAAYFLDHRDGSSGRRFRQEMEQLARERTTTESRMFLRLYRTVIRRFSRKDR